MPRDDLPILEFADREAWARWLQDEHDGAPGVWLKIAKKASGITTVTHPEALEEALCRGWIDGQRAPHDETYFLQRFTPRGPRSKWSQINRDKATKLIEQGRMEPAGLAQVEAAKQDGRWEAAYPPQSSAAVPEDFQRALDENPAAKSSSRRSGAPAATASSTGSPTPSGRRRARDESASSWRCWPRAARTTDRIGPARTRRA